MYLARKFKETTNRSQIKTEISLKEEIYRQKLELEKIGIVLPFETRGTWRDKHNQYIHLVSAFTALTTVNSILSPGLLLDLKLDESVGISEQVNTYTGLYFIGAMVGATCCLHHSTRPRREMFLFAALLTLMSLGVLSNVYSSSFIIASRFIGGFGTGVQVVAAAFYYTESVMPIRKYRNILIITYYSVACTAIVLFLGVNFNWRIVLQLVIFSYISIGLYIIDIPESPYILAVEKELPMLWNLVKSISGKGIEDPLVEYNRILDDVDKLNNVGGLRNPKLIKHSSKVMNVFYICIWHQMTGISAYICFQTIILEHIYIGLSPMYISFLVSLMAVLLTLASGHPTKYKKRLPVIRNGSLKMGIFSLLFGTLFIFKSYYKFTFLINIVLFIIYLIIISNYYNGFVVIPTLVYEEALSYKNKLTGIPIIYGLKFLVEYLFTQTFVSSSPFGVGCCSIIYGILSIHGYMKTDSLNETLL